MKERLIEIIAGIEKELQNLQNLRSELKRIISEKDIIFKRSKGSIRQVAKSYLLSYNILRETENANHFTDRKKENLHI